MFRVRINFLYRILKYVNFEALHLMNFIGKLKVVHLNAEFFVAVFLSRAGRGANPPRQG